MSFLLKKINEKKSNVLIIGLGYVGWPLYLAIKKKKFNVFEIDIKKKLVKKYKIKFKK